MKRLCSLKFAKNRCLRWTSVLLGGLTTFGVTKHFLKKRSLAREHLNRNHFNFGSFMIPHPEKAYKGGEDACYADTRCLVVADGVGGWAEVGIDPALYSKQLVKNISELFNSNVFKYLFQPKKLINDAYEQQTKKGSSTIVVTMLNDIYPFLHTSLMGDSQYIILRKKGEELETVFQSESHQRRFNFPYQLGIGGGMFGHKPDVTVKGKHYIQHDDILVLAPDGVVDNLYLKEIKEIVLKNMRTGA